jgi:protein-tyrosine-phosphatase
VEDFATIRVAIRCCQDLGRPIRTITNIANQENLMRRTHLEKNILFLAEDSASLGLMAEAMAKHLSPPKVRVFSAGLRPGRIAPELVRVLEEVGVSVTVTPKEVKEIPLDRIDLVVSLDDAHVKSDSLPPKAKIEKWPVPNPLQPAVSGRSGLSLYREGRDEIDRRFAALFLDHWRHVA